MNETYQEYIQRHAAEAENALFELRNALMGTGIEECDEQAREVDGMREFCADLSREHASR